MGFESSYRNTANLGEDLMIIDIRDIFNPCPQLSGTKFDDYLVIQLRGLARFRQDFGASL